MPDILLLYPLLARRPVRNCRVHRLQLLSGQFFSAVGLQHIDPAHPRQPLHQRREAPWPVIPATEFSPAAPSGSALE
jgi:hypothetical protein